MPDGGDGSRNRERLEDDALQTWDFYKDPVGNTRKPRLAAFPHASSPRGTFKGAFYEAGVPPPATACSIKPLGVRYQVPQPEITGHRSDIRRLWRR